MKPFWFYILLTPVLLITKVSSKEKTYDFEKCGIPSAEYLQSKTTTEAKTTKIIETTTAVEEEEEEDEYSSEYKNEYKNKDDGENEYDDDNDETDPMRRKVMGGRRALMGELPWSVLIETTNERVTCGGTLIGRRHVMTAAHCFKKNWDVNSCTTADMYRIEEIRKTVKVMVGGICRRADEANDCSEAETGKWYNVKNAFYTPFFAHGCSGTYDIALVELSENVPENIHHICLPHLHDTDELNDNSIRLFSFGFGADPLQKFAHSPTPWLQTLEFGVRMPDEECDELENRKPDTMCTYERSEKDVCNGDSGSGVTTSLNGRHYLMGIVSYGSDCEDLLEGMHPGAQVHTNIAFYTAEIDIFLDMMVEDRSKKWMRAEKRFRKKA